MVFLEGPKCVVSKNTEKRKTASLHSTRILCAPCVFVCVCVSFPWEHCLFSGSEKGEEGESEFIKMLAGRIARWGATSELPASNRAW